MAPKPSNALNESGASGLMNFDGVATTSTTPLTQFNVLSGASANTVNNISPSTAGFVLTSNGTSAQPTFQASTGGSTPSLAPYIVGTDGVNDFALIQDAIDAVTLAGVPANIYIKPGTYGENLTVSTQYISLIGLDDVGTVNISGSLTVSGTQGVTLQGIIITNSGNAITISGASNAGQISLYNSTVISTAGKALTVTSSSGSPYIYIKESFLHGNTDALHFNDAGLVVTVNCVDSLLFGDTNAINCQSATSVTYFINGTLNGANTISGEMIIGASGTNSNFLMNDAFCGSGTLSSISSAVTNSNTFVTITNSTLFSSNANAINFPNVNATGSVLMMTNVTTNFDVNKINFPEFQIIDSFMINGVSSEQVSRKFVSADNLGLSNVACRSDIALLQTTGAGTNTLFTFPVSTNEMVAFYADISATNTGYTLSYASQVTGAARRAGGGTTLVGTSLSAPVFDAGFTGSAAVVVSGNNLLIQVTGIALTTINWQCKVRIETL